MSCYESRLFRWGRWEELDSRIDRLLLHRPLVTLTQAMRMLMLTLISWTTIEKKVFICIVVVDRASTRATRVRGEGCLRGR